MENFKADQFELLLEYVKTWIESCPYSHSTGTLCPRDIRGAGIMAPLELLIEPEKEIFLESTRLKMVKALNLALRDVRTAQEAKNSIFYNPVGLNLFKQPKVNDLVLVQVQKDISEITKFGHVTAVGKSTLTILFPNGHENKYSADRAVFVFCPPLGNGDKPHPQTRIGFKN